MNWKPIETAPKGRDPLNGRTPRVVLLVLSPTGTAGPCIASWDLVDEYWRTGKNPVQGKILRWSPLPEITREDLT